RDWSSDVCSSDLKQEQLSLPIAEKESSVEEEQEPVVHFSTRGNQVSNYQLPPLSLLKKLPKNVSHSKENMEKNAEKLENTLQSFGVKANVVQVRRGPAVTRYEIQPQVGVKVSRIVNLVDDLALALAAKDIRMEAPIPGKSAIGIEVPNEEIAIVGLRDVLESDAYQRAKSKLSMALGKDISGSPIIADLQRMPHLLVA